MSADLTADEARLLTDDIRSRIGEINRLSSALVRQARRHRSASSVYFIQAGLFGLIKIGSATDPTARLAMFQTGCPEELRLIAAIPGGGVAERRLHKQFAHLRVRGEWFQPAEELLGYIEQAIEARRRGTP